MTPKYYHYTKWEDFIHGMYDEDKEGRSERVQKAVYLLTHLDLCYEQMFRVTQEWVYATEQNLTNSSINHRAFLGQSACSIWGDVHEDETREAWGILTQEQRYNANKVADQVFKKWVELYERKNNSNYQLTFNDM